MEGGAIVCSDERTKRRIDLLKNFGFTNETTVIESGINGKMNELQAAFGILQLKYVDGYIEKRRAIVERYAAGLEGLGGIRLMPNIPGAEQAYPYFPILIDEEKFGRSRDYVYDELKKRDILARRYFYPLISQFPMYKGLDSARPENLPVATRIAGQVLCLPIYPSLAASDVDRIVELIRGFKA